MTKKDHCYEYAQTERVNKILKDEFYLGKSLQKLTTPKKSQKMLLINTTK